MTNSRANASGRGGQTEQNKQTYRQTGRSSDWLQANRIMENNNKKADDATAAGPNQRSARQRIGKRCTGYREERNRIEKMTTISAICFSDFSISVGSELLLCVEIRIDTE